MITTAEIIRYRMANERLVERQGEAIVPTRYGEFRMIAYRSALDGQSHVALVRGDIEATGGEPVLVRMHTHCLLGDVFGATWCECGQVLDQSLRRIAEEGRGAVIYLHQTSLGFTVEPLAGKPTLQFHRDHALPTLPENQRNTPARHRHRSPDPRRSQTAAHPPADQSSAPRGRPGRLRPGDHRARLPAQRRCDAEVAESAGSVRGAGCPMFVLARIRFEEGLCYAK